MIRNNMKCCTTVFTRYLQAGMDSADVFDRRRRVSSIHKIGLGVLRFTVDHGNPKPQPFSKRLRPAKYRVYTIMQL